MNLKMFLTYSVVGFTGALLLYAIAGSLIFIGTYSLSAAAIVLTVALLAIMVLVTF